MDEWKNININGIAKIEKCVGEFQVWELQKTPYGKFKVKVFERIDGSYAGFTNIRIKNLDDGSPESGVGFGRSITEALEDTLKNFMELLNQREVFSESDFEWAHPDDF
ncbi:hypothetical protein HOO54_04670 [Bacillus sp. WMMC1349]|uniref:hypothetical protein n=1 Tax=Bacillus sp. WMMC1349 TaxID=2736254 RepID=UPI0015532F8D|nr:hypothetical protein [Bacillus sp. WMMC1349]NPC91557.1 hypothetical protein [Bacillus sp. WMMC1349]